MDAKRSEYIHKINYLTFETDSVYHQASLRLGVSDCVSMILYTLYDLGEECLLSDLYKKSGTSKQTVNSALKKLVAEGYLALSSGADQRSKLVQLTPKGEQLACERVDRIPKAEAAALRAMRPEDRAAFICLTRQYRLLLEQQFRESKSKGGTPPEPAAQK